MNSAVKIVLLIVILTAIVLAVLFFTSSSQPAVPPQPGDAAQQSPPPPAEPAGPPIAELPAVITMPQRSTSEVPATDPPLQITIDDITAGQVMVSLAAGSAAVVLPQQSLQPGDTAEFRYNGHSYQLTLKELSDVLAEDDQVTLTITAGQPAEPPTEPPAGPLTEDRKIDLLIQSIADLDGAVFIRNGLKYSNEEAAEHLRYKLGEAGDVISTAELFIQYIGTKSSLTGIAYRIRLADGTELPAADYLNQQLQQIQAAQAAQP